MTKTDLHDKFKIQHLKLHWAEHHLQHYKNVVDKLILTGEMKYPDTSDKPQIKG